MQLYTSYINHEAIIRFVIATLILIVRGCASLPTVVQRTESFALVKISDTALALELSCPSLSAA